jgi:HK97 family phage portal protein
MFISRIRAAADDERSPWGSFWFEPLGSRTATGQRVNADTAMQLSAVYACTRVLTEGFAVLPFKLYRPRANGRGRAPVTEHWAYSLFTRRPNVFQNPFIWREMLQGHLVLRGNAFNEIIDDGSGGVAQLLPRHPDRIKIELLGNGSWRYIYTQPDGSQRVIRRDHMWHIRGLSGDGIVGMNPIEMQREAIGGGLAAQEYGNRFFLNDAKPTGGWIEFPGKIADKSARENLTESIKSAISGNNRHRMLTLDQGMKYHEVGMTNKDSQFLESRGQTRSEIAGMFRVPPHMIGDLSRATFSNIEQQSIDFWQNTMLPWCERWEAAVEELIGDDLIEVEFDFRNLMRGDSASRGIYLHNMVLDGVLTRNEAREWEGLDPIEGLDEPLVPANERGLNDPDPSGEAGPGEELPDAEPKPADDESADARMQQLLRGNAARMARRLIAGQAVSSAVLADAMAIPEPWANTWLGLDLSGLTENQLSASLVELATKGNA